MSPVQPRRCARLCPPIAWITATVIHTAILGSLAMPAGANSQGVQAGVAQARDYAIPAGPLADVLALFSATAGVQLVFDPAPLAGLNSTGLTGRYTVSDGFAQLLRGSRQQLVDKGNGTYALQALPANAQAGGVTALAAVVVTADADPGEATDGTGAYTSRATRSATGLSLSARETPQSVSVVTRQLIDDQGLQTVQEVLRTAPGITATQLDSERHTFYSRGFSIENFQYDGVPTQYTTNYTAGESEVDSVLYDRVEIVRGATGLLTGAGDPSAAINFVRKHADSKVFTGTLTASAASWANYRASADISTPLSNDGRVRGRLVAAEEGRNGYISGYHRERQTLYGVVDADLTAATTISAGASYQRSRAEGITYGGFPLVYSNGAPIDWRSRGRSFSIWPKWSTEDTDTYNAFAQLEHHWENGWKTTVLGMYSRQEVDNTRLFPWGFPDATTGLLSASPSRVKFPGARDQHSLDVRSSGSFDALGRTHEAIFGVSYSRQEADFDRIGASDALPAVSLFNWAAFPAPTAWGRSVSSATYDRRQSGAYGAVRWSLADPLKLILGGRLNHWEYDGAGYMGRTPYSLQVSKFSPYAGLVHDLGKHYSLYGSYTTIYNPQNYQDRNGGLLSPVDGSNLETGIKGEFMDGRVQASAALFRIKQDNVAQADRGYVVPGTTTQAYVGARGVTSKGVEFELNGQIAQGWNLAFNAAHFRASDANGKQVNEASPRTVVRVFSSYRLPGDWNRLTVGGGLNWQSKTVNVTGVYHSDNPNGLGAYNQGAYVQAGLMARYQFNPQVALQVNIDNLFDKWYYTSVNFNEQLMWGAPRSYRATLTYKF